MAVNNLDDVIKLAAEIAVQTTMQHLEREKHKHHKGKKDWRLRNTKLLLKNYRLFVEHSSETKLAVDQWTAAVEDLYTEEFEIESIKRSKQRTLAMVQFMQHMLEVYRIMCERSKEPEDLRRFKVIDAMYISDKIYTVDEIAECQKIDPRTVYRDITEGCKTLSVLIFGVDGIRLE